MANGSYISDLLINGTTLYVGGSYNLINGVSHSSVSSFNLLTGSLTAFNVNLVSVYIPQSANVLSMNIIGSNLYNAGFFEKIGAVLRHNFASVDSITGSLNSLDLNISQYSLIKSLASSGTNLFIGGNFSSIGGQTRNYLGELNASTYWFDYVI